MNDEEWAIAKEEISGLRQITDTLTKNTTRSLRLLQYSLKLEKQIKNEDEFMKYMDDVARATIVFMHSAFETALRAVVGIKLRNGADIGFLPFPGRKEKLTLKELEKYRGSSVAEVLDKSIDAFLSNLSFNNSNDVADILSRLKIPQDKLQRHYPALNQLMERRHKIVHEADLKRTQTGYELEKIDIPNIEVWLNAIEQFFTPLVEFILEDVYLDKIVKRLNESGYKVSRRDVSLSVRANRRNPSSEQTASDID
jgi:hypothetical protein